MRTLEWPPPKELCSGDCSESGPSRLSTSSYTNGNIRIDEFGITGTKGQWIVQPKLQAADDFSEGLARAKSDGKWGFIDVNGRWVMEPQYKDAENFIDGYAVVKTKDGWGIINKTGEFVVKPSFKKLRTREEDKLFTAMF